MAYLSQVQLRRSTSVSALIPLLLGDSQKGGNSDLPGHHLIWSLFADQNDRKRDFLWVELKVGKYLVLSKRIPTDHHRLFEVSQPKLFQPHIEEGDRLQFRLRANPVVRRRDPIENKLRKHDVVMEVLRNKSNRRSSRFEQIRKQGILWLERQGLKGGFECHESEIRTEGYRQHVVSSKAKSPSLKFSTLEFEGVLTVTQPSAFLSSIVQGFGSSKSYGCGLMLIRRA
ncbi:MAG: type I-E CRISPR-associated protein Cas6/Cse3/CasE [Gammaproteobacteria bacterium]|nr:type I-E CRISPR-associated protein Cas6/Cse3/CasE [Gammaproteobacteria bacterium]MYF53500.1 type I-E CRISPR-associated protein Cas6/Cse3/CasE [Gammaproteobacteria bacterium]MYK44218.1 type I-E CRISPR-associated protein Cas6/Cse3/CasE [Gammaproteobacteria bacterium]